MGRRIVAIASALALGSSGCSLLYGKGRPHAGNPPTQYVHCTNVYGPIVIDGLLATVYTVSAIALIQNHSNTSSEMETNTGAYATFFILPAIFALSGAYGIAHVNDCSKHHEAWARLHPESPNGPVPQAPMYPPAAYPPAGYPPPAYSPQPPPPMPMQPFPPAQPSQPSPSPPPAQPTVPATQPSPSPTPQAPAAPHK